MQHTQWKWFLVWWEKHCTVLYVSIWASSQVVPSCVGLWRCSEIAEKWFFILLLLHGMKQMPVTVNKRKNSITSIPRIDTGWLGSAVSRVNNSISYMRRRGRRVSPLQVWLKWSDSSGSSMCLSGCFLGSNETRLTVRSRRTVAMTSLSNTSETPSGKCMNVSSGWGWAEAKVQLL